MSETPKETRERVGRAWTDKTFYERQLKDIYDYVMPYRNPAGIGSTNTLANSPGENRTDKIFDGTAPSASLRFAGRFQSEFAPLFQDFFKLEPGPLVPKGEKPEEQAAWQEFASSLEVVSHVANGVLAGGRFHIGLQEMALDLFAGTGAMHISEGTDAQPVICRAAPISEIALTQGPFGDIWGVDWKRQFKLGELKRLWPHGKFGAQLERRMQDNPTESITLHQDTMFDGKVHRLRVFADGAASGGDGIFWEEEFAVTPWVTPRFFVVPGEAYGRGLAHLGLPYCKTTNKVRELALLAAAFSVLGLWAVRNDGVFNPDQVSFQPLAMWKVASNGGPLGSSIQRLETPQNFDVTSFVIQDERDQMKQAMMDVNLPPLAGAVRSPTEIAERMKLYSQDFGGVFGRLVLEIAIPTAQRTVQILEKRGYIKKLLGADTKITIDNLLTQAKVTSPIALGQQADKVEKTTRWLELLSALLGQQAAVMFANVEELGPEMGRWMGVDERYIRSATDIAEMQKQLAAAMAANAQAQQKPAPEPDPNGAASPYVNGAGA
ncbi:hypothetical protein JDN40_14360 [Rhodomicrobium vannielii ATCC 17100]|uniref:portal protein n=1 Tax=Rhodomicrobium vannielii TaxID=1069 RepID=UPI001919A1B5|nr:portal protein [Rhodomicrobium vannielii]MBJ7535291.1 hypothetical protein [Rhodomicrobium vannielii ATCC 17100]